MSTRPGSAPARILMMQLRSIGDVLMCTPAIRQVRRRFPDAALHFLSAAPAAQVLHGNPHLDELIGYRNGWRSGWSRVRKLRRERYDLVLDFHSMPRTAIATALTGAPVRIGYAGRGPRERVYTSVLPKYSELPRYQALRKLELLAAAGIPCDPEDLDLELAPDPAEIRWAEREWQRIDRGEGRTVVALSGVSRDPLKRWAPERWAAVGDALVRRGARVLLTGGPGEESQVAVIAGAMAETPVRAEAPPSVAALAALLARCAAWEGNDGGPRHVAVAAGVPTLSVGASDAGPRWTDPRPERGHVYVSPPARASVAEELAALPADVVVEAALSAYERALTRGRSAEGARRAGAGSSSAGRSG